MTMTKKNKLHILLHLLLPVLLLVGCAPPVAGGSPTMQGLDLAQLEPGLKRVVETLHHLHAASVAAGMSDPTADRVVTTIVDVAGALQRMAARADLNGDRIVGGEGVGGAAEWFALLSALGLDLVARLSALPAAT